MMCNNVALQLVRRRDMGDELSKNSDTGIDPALDRPITIRLIFSWAVRQEDVFLSAQTISRRSRLGMHSTETPNGQGLCVKPSSHPFADDDDESIRSSPHQRRRIVRSVLGSQPSIWFFTHRRRR